MRKLFQPPVRFVPAIFAALVAVAAAGAAQANQRIEIVDYGIYDHVVTEVVPEPKDVAGEPGNLALVEMALSESWKRRNDKENGGDLARAYQHLDRLEGALACAAEEVFWNPTNESEKLTDPERPIAEALFMRLVRAGDAGGARPASLR